jgi:hypothetical protein
MMKTWQANAAVVFLGALTAGCETTGKPNWMHPGSAQQQQARAVQFDPYPENEPGPKMEGVRPREYEKPIPEVDRARWESPANPWSASWLPWNWSRK